MQPRVTESGVFIAFEGGEGAGKSTQAELLAQRLQSDGFDVLLTREPGGTAVGKRLRELVLEPETGSLSARTEALIYAADKAEHVDTVLDPALAARSVVITDRYVDSALAYQGAGRALRLDELELINGWATGGLRPHVTIVLDLDPATGLSRFEGADRIEAEPLEFHQRVREGFLRLAASDPQHYAVIDAQGNPDHIHAAIKSVVQPWLGQARSSQLRSQSVDRG